MISLILAHLIQFSEDRVVFSRSLSNLLLKLNHPNVLSLTQRHFRGTNPFDVSGRDEISTSMPSFSPAATMNAFISSIHQNFFHPV